LWSQDINPQLVARLSQRLFFVVNKVDLMRTSEGLEPEEIKEYVAELVTSQLSHEGFHLSPDQVSRAAQHVHFMLAPYAGNFLLKPWLK
jgi:hypothetical protein